MANGKTINPVVPSGGGSGGTDHHSGWETIPSSGITILENKQMVVFGILKAEGDLLNEGTLIIEA